MNLQEYRKDFIEDVKSTALNDEDGTVASFVKVATDNLVATEVLPDFEHCFFVGIGKRNKRIRVDGYCLDEFDYTMNLIISDYDGSESGKTLIKTEALQIFERLSAFVDEAINGKLYKSIEISTPVYDLIDLVRTNKGKIRKYRFLLLTDAYVSERIGNLSTNKINDLTVEYHIWDISRFFKVCYSDNGRDNLEIDFLQYTHDGIPCLEVHTTSLNEYRCFLCVIPGNTLADIYDRYGGQLLEGNVRSFLSTKVAVNKKIRETILRKPKMFFIFNNGIAATASDVVIENKTSGKFLTYAKDLQIVNGGQTTASLSNARFRDKANLDNVFVQMKLTEVDILATNDIIPQISKCSNSQNKVSEADFFSNHHFHIRMEQISRRLYAPAVGGSQHDTHWFYERARGQYLQAQLKMTQAEKGKFIIQNPKSQLITKTDLAKIQNSWRCIPHIVSKGAQTNFVEFAEWIEPEWNIREADFNEAFFRESVALTILFKHVEKLITHQPWYEKGYRANIVTYSMALLSYLIIKLYPDKMLDLQMIWNKQEISDVIDHQMVLITKVVYDEITDINRDTVNVTQWCKREACWNKVKSIDIKLIPQIEAVLISKDESKNVIRDARKDQKVINGIEAQVFVVNLGNEYWDKVLQFGLKKKLVSTDDINLLQIASKMTSAKIPNSIQCQKLQDVRIRLLLEGFSEA